MRGALVIAACLLATPLSAQQLACVSDVAEADEASRKAGEELALELETNGGVPMRMYLSRDTWTVWFQQNGQWCTAPSMVGKIKVGEAA